MFERHPVVAALLDDGLQRGYQDSEIGEWLKQRMSLIHASSITALANITTPLMLFISTRCIHTAKKVH